MSGALEKPSVAAIILAVLFPPLGVWIARGIGSSFWVSLILTCLGYLPGMIFSLIAVLRPNFVEGLRTTP